MRRDVRSLRDRRETAERPPERTAGDLHNGVYSEGPWRDEKMLWVTIVSDLPVIDSEAVMGRRPKISGRRVADFAAFRLDQL